VRGQTTSSIDVRAFIVQPRGNSVKQGTIFLQSTAVSLPQDSNSPLDTSTHHSTLNKRPALNGAGLLFACQTLYRRIASFSVVEPIFSSCE
jgi:hypothetical protein